MNVNEVVVNVVMQEIETQKRNKTHESQERNVLLTRWRFETAEEMMQIVQTLSSPEARKLSGNGVQCGDWILLVAMAGFPENSWGSVEDGKHRGL